MSAKEPERLLGSKELAELTGFHVRTVQEMLKKDWAVPGGTKLIRGEHKLTVSFYNRWLASRDVAVKEGARG